MCSAADDPTTYDPTKYDPVDIDPYREMVVDRFPGWPKPSLHEVERLEIAIARRNIAWAKWQDEADELYNRVTDGERPHFGPYNDAQKTYEHAVSDLMREQARWNYSRHA